jgi:hypothetical protein
MKTTTRFLGKCGVCEGEFKLTNGKLVHHGYQRPGDGAIHGDCFAVGRAPLELSPAATVEYRALLVAHIARLQARLAALPTLTELHITNSRHEVRIVKSSEPHFANCLRSEQWSIEGNIRHTEHEVARLTALVANWAPKPVRTVEEETQKLAAEKAARAAVKAEKAAEKAVAQSAKLDRKVALFQRKLAKAVKARNSDDVWAVFRDAEESARRFDLTRQAMLDLVDQDGIFAKFGLKTPTSWNDACNVEVMRRMLRGCWF